jgi:hypothetical protein
MVRPGAQTTIPSLSPPGHIVFYTDVPDSGKDPWASFLSPPTNETREERSERLARERHAKEVSDEIDDEIEKERELEKKAPKMFRILLLGMFPICKRQGPPKEHLFIYRRSKRIRYVVSKPTPVVAGIFDVHCIYTGKSTTLKSKPSFVIIYLKNYKLWHI